MAATKSKSKKSTSTRKRSSSASSAGATKSGVNTAGNPRQDVANTVVHVDDTNRRDELDAVPGRPAIITAGDDEGTQGYIYEITSYSKKDGYPDKVTFRPRNVPNVILNVNYSDVDALLGGYN